MDSASLKPDRHVAYSETVFTFRVLMNSASMKPNDILLPRPQDKSSESLLESQRERIAQISGFASLLVVRTHFMEHTQEDRPIRITTSLGSDALLLESMVADEFVSQPFQIRCQVLAENLLPDLVGEVASVHLEVPDAKPRFFHGRIRAVTQKAIGESSSGTLLRYELEIVPDLWFLTLTSDCRVFQSQTMEQIVTTVLRESGIKSFQFKLASEYPEWRYCVQYRESNFHFLSRLLEQEGISYYFEHDRNEHRLIFTDVPNRNVLKAQPALYFQPEAGYRDRQPITDFQLRRNVVPNEVALKDFDFKKPSRHLMQECKVSAGIGQVYEYPGLFFDQEQGRRYSGVRAEELEVGSVQGCGRSFCRQLAPGHWFEMKGHPDPSLNQPYFVTSVRHEADNSRYRSGPGDGFSYQNSFNVIRNQVRFRPPRKTARPVVPGAQSATVVGPEGEEVYTDKYGRVKVQFHWDRRGRFDQNSSCWVRVSQPWAGKDWGAISIPRIGQEVLVDFLEGDPDRPVISGRLYNAERMPPYELPSKCSNMGFKSKSIFGNGYNEIAIDDTNGVERIVIHAQHDMDTKILHNDTIAVGNNRTESVGVDEQVSIGNNRVLQVGNNNIEQVTANKKVSVGESILVEAGVSITLKCGASMIHMNQAGVVVIQGTMVTVNGSIMTSVTAPLTTVAGLALLTAGALSMNAGQWYWVQGGTTNIRGTPVKINS
jgi:type VI secretion system secreted protein VgrG